MTDKKTDQEAKKPISMQEYTKLLQKEYDIAKLRAGIAKCLFEEKMALIQLRQIEQQEKAAWEQANSAENVPAPNATSTEDVRDEVPNLTEEVEA